MSMTYCHDCDVQVDTDYNAEHFEEHENDCNDCDLGVTVYPKKDGVCTFCEREVECDHHHTTLYLAEDLRHPDDPVSTSQWHNEFCDDCDAFIGEIQTSIYL